MSGPDARTHQVTLRPVVPGDLDTLFAFQCDPASAQMAMVIPRTRAAFDAIWQASLASPQQSAWAIVIGDTLVGSIGCFESSGKSNVGYAIGRPYWGRGFATSALRQALDLYPPRPLYASAATSNAASIRVLTRCGFAATGTSFEPATERYLACEVSHFVRDMYP